MTSRSEAPLSADDLCARLLEVCTCDGDPAPGDDWQECLFCEARERIEAQDRALRLAQGHIARLRTSQQQQVVP